MGSLPKCKKKRDFNVFQEETNKADDEMCVLVSQTKFYEGSTRNELLALHLDVSLSGAHKAVANECVPHCKGVSTKGSANIPNCGKLIGGCGNWTNFVPATAQENLSTQVAARNAGTAHPGHRRTLLPRLESCSHRSMPSRVVSHK